MFGNFPTNDDWIFLRQVEAFSKDIFTLSAKLDPSFITQGFLGLGWGKLFGISFLSLQILTFLLTLLTAVLFYKTFSLLNVKRSLALVTSLILFFNPLVFTSAFSFMTDNYFAFFLVFTIYTYLMFVQTKHIKFFVMALLGAVLATLTRQIGVVLFLGMAIQHLRSKKVIATIITMVAAYALVYFWPRYDINPMFLQPQDFMERVSYILLSLHYFPLFIFPLFFGLQKHKNWKVLLPITTVAAIFLFVYDFFPVGNVLYLEGLHIKSDFKPIFSLFDNLLFKTLLAGMVGYSFALCITFFIENFKTFFSYKISATNKFLLSLLGMNLGILFISSDYYDRYLIPSLIIFYLVLIPKITEQIEVNKKVVTFLSLLIFTSITLQLDFSSKRNLMWQQAYKLQKAKNIMSQISLNDTYSNYVITQVTGDYTGLNPIRRFGFKCYVQNYTTDSTWLPITWVENMENYIENHYLDNPRPFSTKKKEMPRVKNNLDSLIYNEPYFSPLYNSVGKGTFVGSWCVDL